METRNAVLLAVAACGAGLLAGFLLFHSSHEEGREAVHAAGDSEVQKPVEPAVKPPDLERSDNRVPAFIERAPESPPVVAASEPAKPATSDPADPRTLPETTLAEMNLKRNALHDYLTARTTPIILQRFEDGLTEHLQDDPVWRGGDSEAERSMIYGIQGGGGIQGLNRTVLPRWQYPELYAFKDEIVRLDKVIPEKEAAGYREKQAAQSVAPRR